jgi:plastocyanin
VLPGPATAVAIAFGTNGQLAAPGSPVQFRPRVHVTDAFRNPVPGVPVAFEVVSGGGTVDGAPTTTDTFGSAAVTSWRLGSSPGPNTLRATAGTLTPVIFTATAAILPTAITIEVHNDFFRSVRNGSVSDDREYAVDTVAVGGTITWVWMGQNHNVEQVSHDFHVEPKPKMSPSGNQDAPFTFGPITFSSRGDLYYRCTNHSFWGGDYGKGMKGRVLVR